MRMIKTAFAGVIRAGRRLVGALFAAIGLVGAVIIEAIGYRELLLLGGATMVGYGVSLVYPPAAFIAPGIIFVGVAIFGVR